MAINTRTVPAANPFTTILREQKIEREKIKSSGEIYEVRANNGFSSCVLEDLIKETLLRVTDDRVPYATPTDRRKEL